MRLLAISIALLAACSNSGSAPAVRCTGDQSAATSGCYAMQPMNLPGSPIVIDHGQVWVASCSDGELTCTQTSSGTDYHWSGSFALCTGYTPRCANGSAPQCRPVSCAAMPDGGP